MASILYISYDGALDPLGQSQVVPYLVGLARRGFRVCLLTFEKPERLKDREGRLRLSRRLDSVGIAWHAFPYHAWPPVLSTLWDVIYGFFRGWIRRENAALIHARSYPSALIGAWLSRALAVPLLFDMRGFYPEERVEGGYWKPDGLLYRTVKSVESSLFARASGIVTLTEASLPVLRSALEKIGVGVPIRVIPTCVDLGLFRPAVQRQRVRDELGLGPGPVVAHVGTLGGWYRGEFTFRIAGACVERLGGEFVVITEQGPLAEVLAERTGVSARVLQVSHGDMPHWLSSADLGLAVVRPGFSKTASSPTKVAEYLASGMAVVGTAGVGDLCAQFEGSSVARAISSGETPESVAAWAEQAVNRPLRRREARTIAREHYDLEQGIDALTDLYSELGVRP